MKKTKKLFLVSCGLILSTTVVLTACSSSSTNSSNVSETTISSERTISTSELSKGEINTTLAKIDNTKWLYNADDKIYYQIGISYAATPIDAEQQTLSIFIPEAYITATKNSDDTYTVEPNYEGKVGDYTAKTAPVVIPINTPGYSAMSALTSYSQAAKTYTDAGYVYVSAGLRGRDSGAPGGVTDAKAVIRYLRYNTTKIVGNTDNVFVFGTSGGGAQASILGASGDSDLYDDYLQEIGAVEGVSDAVTGVMAWVPITNLDTGNAAYEWNLGSARTDLSETEQALSDGLAKNYAKYINSLGLKNPDKEILTLESSEQGIYQAGSYYDYIKQTIEDSLNTFLETTAFPYDASSNNSGMPGGGMPPGGEGPLGELPDGEMPEGTLPFDGGKMQLEDIDDIQRSNTTSNLNLSDTYETVSDYIDALNATSKWVNYDESTNTATITSVADFVQYLKQPSKSVPAFDSLDAKQGENELFGIGNGGIHWDSMVEELLTDTTYNAAYEEDLATVDHLGNDLTTRINMYTPLYYLSDYYEGTNTSNVASYWRIRTGINQGDTALSTEVNLSLALENSGRVADVDFATVWGQGHTEAEISGTSSENLIIWINEVMNEISKD